MATTQKRDFPTTVRVPKDYHQRAQKLADKDILKLGPWMSQKLMKVIDDEWKKLKRRKAS